MKRATMAVLLAGAMACGSGRAALPGSLVVLCPMWGLGQPIPKEYTCDGDDVSPPLTFQNAPAATKSYAIICNDPDAPGGNWYHWVIYNLPAGSTGIDKGVAKTDAGPGGSIQGRNSFGKIGYNGPCPPPGPGHRYYFRVYALDMMLTLPAGSNADALLDAMKGHVLAEGYWSGSYGRQ